jgi:hypothetical protein
MRYNVNREIYTYYLHIQGVSAKTFEPNISVICQRIFMKFKMQDILDREGSISNNKITSS